MRSTAAGGVRHDRPLPTPPHVVVVVAVARGGACAGGRWRSPLSALRGLRHAPPPSLARAAPSRSTSLPPLSAVVRRSCAPDASSSAKKRDTVVLFPLRRIVRGTKPPLTGRGGTCCSRPSPPSGCDLTTEVALIPQRVGRREQGRDVSSESAHCCCFLRGWKRII
jgi:hypothetical protein